MHYLLKSILVLFVLLLTMLTGCAHKVVVSVNAITDTAASVSGKRYYLTNMLESTQSSDLYFKEFRRYFDHILKKQGYEKSNNLANADLEILFSYGVSDGRTGIYTYSWPIYETFGGETVTITEKTTNTSGATTTTRRTVRIPAYTRQVGNSYETRSYTLYNRYANLAAFPLNDGTSAKSPIWTVEIQSVGNSNDLRATMPYLAAASNAYIAKNSGRQQSITLSKDNALLLELKQLLPN
ncbi:MAG: hypothetical protein GXP08_05260 [Gammaproteobacteria bacterium]|nr:hypothetical protein [Gammaproteobacteria bacterium]